MALITPKGLGGETPLPEKLTTREAPEGWSEQRHYSDQCRSSRAATIDPTARTGSG
jgi:hypothetical protein